MKGALLCTLAACLLSPAAYADVSSLLGQDVVIMSAKTGKVLATDVGDSQNGANVFQADYTADDAQLWNIQALDNGAFTLTHKKTTKVLEVADAGSEDGDNLRIWDYFPVAHHQWSIDLIGGDVYKLTSSASDKVIDVAGGFDSAGTNVQQWEYFANPQQHWVITPAGAGQSTVVYEAESAQNVDAPIVSEAGASAGQYVRFEDDNRLDFSVPYTSGNTYSYTLTYRSLYGTKNQDLYVDDNFVAEITFPQTGDWTTVFLPIDIENDGANHKISLVTNWGYVDIDRLNVTVSGSGSTQLPEVGVTEIEAESALLTGDTQIQQNSNASNQGFVKFEQEGNLRFKFYVEQAGTYDVVIRHSGQGIQDTKYMFVEHAGVVQNIAFVNDAVSWKNTTATFDFTAGENIVDIYNGWGYMAFDKVSVVNTAGGGGLTDLFYGGDIYHIDRISGTYSQGRCGTSYMTAVTQEEGLLDGHYYIEGSSQKGFCFPGDVNTYVQIYLDLVTGTIFKRTTLDGVLDSEVTYLPPQQGGDRQRYIDHIDGMISNVSILTHPAVGPPANPDDINAIVDYLNHVKAVLDQ